MQKAQCSPRHQNVLDTVDYLVNRGYVPRELSQRFRATCHIEPQHGDQDLGLGLCGRPGSRLAKNLETVSCPECRELLQALFDCDAAGQA